MEHPSNIVDTIDWRLNSRVSFTSSQLRLFRIGEGPGSWRERIDPENRASSLARLSPRLPRQREFMRHLFVVFMRHLFVVIMRHLFVVDSLDKRIQNEKELIHPVSAGGRGLFCICVGSINLNLNLISRAYFQGFFNISHFAYFRWLISRAY